MALVADTKRCDDSGGPDLRSSQATREPRPGWRLPDTWPRTRTSPGARCQPVDDCAASRSQPDRRPLAPPLHQHPGDRLVVGVLEDRVVVAEDIVVCLHGRQQLVGHVHSTAVMAELECVGLESARPCRPSPRGDLSSPVEPDLLWGTRHLVVPHQRLKRRHQYRRNGICTQQNRGLLVLEQERDCRAVWGMSDR